MSYTEKEHVSPPSISKRDIKKIKSFDAIEVEMKVAFVETKSSSSEGAISAIKTYRDQMVFIQ
ncbi:hypothetical protein H5410_047065 [Solanum commersonii]|uniref:Uncharacterized protein n=1 Tax=Solanum commersonii TaxID=4109 RepID=A0A9J5XG63_SOLCO|nr:hypothetical protein H5410_047065 [Solanum commersonii]